MVIVHIMELVLRTKAPMTVAGSFDRIRILPERERKPPYAVGSLLQAVDPEPLTPVRTMSALQGPPG